MRFSYGPLCCHDTAREHQILIQTREAVCIIIQNTRKCFRQKSLSRIRVFNWVIIFRQCSENVEHDPKFWAGSCKLFEIWNQLQIVLKSWSQISHDPTNDVKSTLKYPGDSSSDFL